MSISKETRGIDDDAPRDVGPTVRTQGFTVLTGRRRDKMRARVARGEHMPTDHHHPPKVIRRLRMVHVTHIVAS
jgi:hypothetical protein